MASIGPQLPPQLQKRKRTPDKDDDAAPGSPPHKASRRDDPDEIALDDDSDDGFGPRAPGPNRHNVPSPRPKPVIGPTLPATAAASGTSATTDKPRSGPMGPSPPETAPPRPSQASTAPENTDEIPLDSDSDSDAPGPAPPTRTIGPAPPPAPKRVLGPAPPPGPLSERPPTNPDSDSDSDDDYGPALPGAAGASRPSTIGPSLPSSFSNPEPSSSTAPKRDDWMLAPPTGDSTARAPDPTKLKARRFASGPRAATEARQGGGISSIWTETPEEKARRLANAVLGREDPRNAPAPPPPSATGSGGSSSSSSRKLDEARLKAYVEQTRGRSLVEEHQAARSAAAAGRGGATLARNRDDAKWGKKGGEAEEEEDDPSKRAFDWEKDMKVGGRITHAQRRELMNRAANFGNRFQSGKYL
ncbi:hypothetical protein VTJ49DRAFT_1368 [Mycothermus thermophilus]|uniref:DUF3752 domain-containing protein n=1 Tax=Humicola insolens TaxID=85995 RepID=A0ABR3VPD0_HUMIN